MAERKKYCARESVCVCVCVRERESVCVCEEECVFEELIIVGRLCESARKSE